MSRASLYIALVRSKFINADSHISNRGDWDLRNLSTGAIAYLPESLLNISPSVSDLRDHIHAVKSELDILKHASLPSLAYSIGEVAGSAPIAFPVASPSKIVRVLTRALALFCMQSFQAILTKYACCYVYFISKAYWCLSSLVSLDQLRIPLLSKESRSFGVKNFLILQS